MRGSHHATSFAGSKFTCYAEQYVWENFMLQDIQRGPKVGIQLLKVGFKSKMDFYLWGVVIGPKHCNECGSHLAVKGAEIKLKIEKYKKSFVNYCEIKINFS